MKPNFYRARIASRVLLRRIRSTAQSGDQIEFLRSALDFAAADLKLNVEHVPSIGGDNQIAGALERPKRKVLIATKFPYASQRFTWAHEIAHFILHTGTIYFRDRELSAPGSHRDYREVEADAFAAEFLMPRNLLAKKFQVMFGEPIDGTVPNPDLVVAVSAGASQRVKWTPEEFSSQSPLIRASAIATAHTYKGHFFASLIDQFNVSPKAMGIQLLQMGLVT